MAHKLADIVDIERLQRVCDGLATATGIATAVIDPGGTVLVSSGWQDICTQFHRRGETTLAGCLESDRRINESIQTGLEAPRHIAYRCANGLWDVAFPLVIADERDCPGLVHDRDHFDRQVAGCLLGSCLRGSVRKPFDLNREWFSTTPQADTLAREGYQHGDDHRRNNRSCHEHEERVHACFLR